MSDQRHRRKNARAAINQAIDNSPVPVMVANLNLLPWLPFEILEYVSEQIGAVCQNPAFREKAPEANQMALALFVEETAKAIAMAKEFGVPYLTLIPASPVEGPAPNATPGGALNT